MFYEKRSYWKQAFPSPTAPQVECWSLDVEISGERPGETPEHQTRRMIKNPQCLLLYVLLSIYKHSKSMGWINQRIFLIVLSFSLRRSIFNMVLEHWSPPTLPMPCGRFLPTTRAIYQILSSCMATGSRYTWNWAIVLRWRMYYNPRQGL